MQNYHAIADEYKIHWKNLDSTWKVIAIRETETLWEELPDGQRLRKMITHPKYRVSLISNATKAAWVAATGDSVDQAFALLVEELKTAIPPVGQEQRIRDLEAEREAMKQELEELRSAKRGAGNARTNGAPKATKPDAEEATA